MNTDLNLGEVPESILDVEFELELFYKRPKISKEVFNRALAKERLARAVEQCTIHF